MKLNLFRTCAFVGAVVAFAACSDHPTAAPTARAPGASAQHALNASSNGEGQCMFQDAVSAGYKQNSLQCTANDVSIGEADVTHYCVTDDPILHPCSPTTVLNSGDRISCIPGQHIEAKVDALIQNSAQERYDMGLWILDPGLAGNANTGSQCTQYNLIPNQNGAVNLDGDSCGDVNSTTTTITVPLDVLDLTCPSNGQTTVSIQACAGWSNSTTGSNDIVCPIPGVTPDALAFREGTTPPEGSKCTCNALALAIDVKAVLRIKKLTVPSGSAQSFGFTTTGTGYTTPFSLTDGTTNSSGPLSAGTYTAAETPVGGWDLTLRACVNTNDQSAHTFTNITNGVSVGLASGDDVTCTFTNTQKPTLTVNKVCVPTTDGGKFNLQIDAATAGTGGDALCGGTTGSQLETIGAHTVGETQGTGTLLSNYNTPVIGGDCASNGAITLVAGQNAVCTITNTRKPHLTVNKICAPTTDGGKFNLQIDAATVGTGGDALCGGTTGSQLETIGAHTVGETQGTGTLLSDYGTPVIGGDCASNGAITLVAGQNAVCSITNTRKPKVKLVKSLNPTNDAGRFDLTLAGILYNNGNAGFGDGGNTDFQFVAIGTVSMSEAGHTGTSLGSYTSTLACVNAANAAVTVSPNNKTSGSISVVAGDVITCTITNTRRATVTINKRENGVLPLVHTWSFEIRSGASTSAAGTLEATGTANTTTGVVNFACSPEDANCTNVGGIAQLLPGTYQLCETGMPVGYHNNITGFTPLGAVVEGQDNSTECIGITLGIGGSGVPTGVPDPIDNVQPPGGDARTIGYWKNWSSCTGGKQYINATAPGGVGIGRTLDGYLPSSAAVLAIGNILSLTCPQAVNLLGKSDINTGTKMASDAAYGLAAQLFAAELNVAAGAAHSACADAAMTNGSNLLKGINFLGTGPYLGKVSGPTQTALKNNALLYASQLDQYNNNTLPCP
jgi:hypothetical protein